MFMYDDEAGMVYHSLLSAEDDMPKYSRVFSIDQANDCCSTRLVQEIDQGMKLEKTERKVRN